MFRNKSRKFGFFDSILLQEVIKNLDVILSK